MKKIFIIALAAAALVACTKENTLQTADKVAITFENAFVDNATKATDLTTTNLTDFGVYAALENSKGEKGLILNNEKVSGNITNGYTYGNTQYWVPQTQYYFSAIAPYQTGADAAWTYTTDYAYSGTIAYNAEKDIDLLYAYSEPDKTAATITSKPAPISFTFNHMLSRTRFTFINAIPATSNITLKITDVKITDADKNGELKITDGTPGEWSKVGNNTYTISFANTGITIPGQTTGVENWATTEHHYILPIAKTINVTFTIEVFQAGVSLGTYNRATTVVLDPKKGLSYDIKASLTADNVLPNALYPIEFTVNTITNWADFADINSGNIVTQ